MYTIRFIEYNINMFIYKQLSLYLYILCTHRCISTHYYELRKPIITIRKEKKVSQGDLAAQASLHLNVIGRYERGEAIPSIEIAAKLAESLKVSLDYLVLGKSELNVDQTLLEKVLSIQQLPEEDREHIMYSIDGLIQHAKTRLAYKK